MSGKKDKTTAFKFQKQPRLLWQFPFSVRRDWPAFLYGSALFPFMKYPKILFHTRSA